MRALMCCRKDLQWRPNLAEKFSFETDFLATEIGRLAPAAFKVDGFFLDIGVPEDLQAGTGRRWHDCLNRPYARRVAGDDLARYHLALSLGVRFWVLKST